MITNDKQGDFPAHEDLKASNELQKQNFIRLRREYYMLITEVVSIYVNSIRTFSK